MRCNLALSIGLTLCQVAHAADPTRALAGEYMVIGFASCITAPPGTSFNPVNLAAPSGSTVSTGTVLGTRVFNGDGTGQDTGISVNVNVPNAFGFTGGGSSSNFSGNFTYTVDSALNITIVQSPFTSTVLTGNGVGTTATISNVPQFKGRVSEDLKTIVVQHETPGVELLTGPGPNNTTVTRERICVRERTATRVERGRND